MVFITDIIVGGLLCALPFYGHKHLSPYTRPVADTLADFHNNNKLSPINTTQLVAHLPKELFLPLNDVFGISPQQIFSASFLADIFALSIIACLSYTIWYFWNKMNKRVQVFRSPRAARQSRLQKAAEFPAPFPNGWFLVEHSHRLAVGEVKEIQAFGMILALFRANDGKAQVLDGICPHLGANLGVAGMVEDNCLKCCFHGWSFDRDGKCTKVNGTDTVPKGAFVRKFPTREMNGCIFVYHDAEGRDPEWEIENFAPVTNGDWYIGGETSNVVHAHIFEIPENGSDVAHLNVLHKDFVVEGLNPSFSHLWSADWKASETKPWTTEIELTQDMTLFGWSIPYSKVNARINQVGPGLVVLRLDTILGSMVTYETLLPTRTTSQIARHILFAAPSVPRIVAKMVMWAFEQQFNRDVPIWESKKYLKKPIISKADGPILNYRRWMSQFISEGSTTFESALAQEYMLDF